MKEWWESLPDSTRRAIKTLWETFLGTFVMVVAMGLVNGWPGLDAFEALIFAAGSAAIAATAAKVVNYLNHERGIEDGEANGKHERL